MKIPYSAWIDYSREEELAIEYNSAADYHSELWASEAASMANEGFNNDPEAFEEGPIVCVPDAKSDRQLNDEAVDRYFAKGGKGYHSMRNEDNGPEW